MTIAQIKVVWTGGPSSPGLTVFNLEDNATPNYPSALAAVRAFFDALKGNIPDEYDLQVQGLVELYSEGTGQLSGEYSAEAAAVPAVVSGIAAGGYMHGVGARVDWVTSSIRNGRRVSGRTYLVPFVASAFGNDGLLVPTVGTAIGTAAQNLLTALSNAGLPLAVWSRPSLTSPTGALAPAIGYRVPTKCAVLRGRRD